MVNRIRTNSPVNKIKDVVQSSVYAPEFDKHLKKTREPIDRNVVNITIKDEDNSPKTLNDKKNHQASSQKFKEINW